MLKIIKTQVVKSLLQLYTVLTNMSLRQVANRILLDDRAHCCLFLLKLFDYPPGWGVVVAHKVEEHIVPTYKQVVGMRIIVHGGSMHIWHVWGEHWSDTAQPDLISGFVCWIYQKEPLTYVQPMYMSKSLGLLGHDSFKVFYVLFDFMYWTREHLPCHNINGSRPCSVVINPNPEFYAKWLA